MRAALALSVPAEPRMYQRRDVDIAASVRYADGTTRPCRVKNISPMGAVLDFGTSPMLPKTFRLVVVSETFSADCEVRHETGTQAGVLFTTSRAEALARFG